MKNITVILFFILISSCAGGREAYALFPQGPREASPPYPYVLSQPVEVLPHGFITIGVGEETYYYSNGVFYQMVMREQKYVAVPPPIGAVVFTIPQGYLLMLIDGVSYYQYEGVYYKRVLEGYKVIYPPV
jgi:hypothetical protein